MPSGASRQRADSVMNGTLTLIGGQINQICSSHVY